MICIDTIRRQATKRQISCGASFIMLPEVTVTSRSLHLIRRKSISTTTKARQADVGKKRLLQNLDGDPLRLACLTMESESL